MIESPHDLGVHQVAALSARAAFVFLCLGLCWGTFTSTGWLHRLAGRQATRGSHVLFVTLALAFATLHALAFLFMQDEHVGPADLIIPLWDGGVPQALGVVTVELMVAIMVSTAAQRFLRHRQWLWLHRIGYPAIGLGVLHSFAGAMIDGHLAVVWLAGLLVLVPTVLVAALRFLPGRLWTWTGLLKVAR